MRTGGALDAQSLAPPQPGAFNLHWNGSLKPLIVPSFFGDAFSIFLLRQFFMTLPNEMLEAARIDGANDWRILLRVVVPVAKPAIAAVGLFAFLFAWNDFYNPLLYTGNSTTGQTLAVALSQLAKSGHQGMPLGMADVATVLWTRFLKFDASDPSWPDRDRFVLSAGHGSMLLYSLLYLTGNAEMTLDQIKRFRQVDSLTPGHPENFRTKGVETTTGPLGQGIANAVGMAIAEAHLSARFSKDLIDHKTYVIASDGDLEEGISHEAISLAGHLKLNKLIVLWDHNNITIDGATSLSESTDMIERFKAAGWTTDSCPLCRANAWKMKDPARATQPNSHRGFDTR